jgi:hypothetical protein
MFNRFTQSTTDSSIHSTMDMDMGHGYGTWIWGYECGWTEKTWEGGRGLGMEIGRDMNVDIDRWIDR